MSSQNPDAYINHVFGVPNKQRPPSKNILRNPKLRKNNVKKGKKRLNLEKLIGRPLPRMNNVLEHEFLDLRLMVMDNLVRLVKDREIAQLLRQQKRLIFAGSNCNKNNNVQEKTLQKPIHNLNIEPKPSESESENESHSIESKKNSKSSLESKESSDNDEDDDEVDDNDEDDESVTETQSKSEAYEVPEEPLQKVRSTDDVSIYQNPSRTIECVVPKETSKKLKAELKADSINRNSLHNKLKSFLLDTGKSGKKNLKNGNPPSGAASKKQGAKIRNSKRRYRDLSQELLGQLTAIASRLAKVEVKRINANRRVTSDRRDLKVNQRMLNKFKH